MGCSARNIQKYSGCGGGGGGGSVTVVTGVTQNLQNVTSLGNVTDFDIETTGMFIGDGGLITNVISTSITTLEQTTAFGNTTSHKVTFQNTYNSIETLGSILTAGNVTASEFLGDGTKLTGVAMESNLSDNSSRIDTLELNIPGIISNISDNSSRIDSLTLHLTDNNSRIDTLELNIPGIISNISDNSSRIDTVNVDLTSNHNRVTTLENKLIITSTAGLSSFNNGDILYASGTSTLSALPVSTTGGDVLTAIGGGAFAWQAVPGAGGSVGTLQAVTTAGATTANQVTFTNTTVPGIVTNGAVQIGTDLSVGNSIQVTNGNMTLQSGSFIGDGSQLTGVASDTLAIIANTASFTGTNQGDILYGSATDTLTGLPLGTDGYVLTADSQTGLPAWKPGNNFNNITENLSNIGISNTNPEYTFQVGANVVIDDVGTDVVYVTGNVYASDSVTAIKDVYTDKIHCTQLIMKNTQVVAERPTRKIRII